MVITLLRAKSNRCAYLHCRKFLNDDMNTGICLDCAHLTIAAIKRFFKVRTVLGIVFAATIFLLIPSLTTLMGLDRIVVIPAYHGSVGMAFAWTFASIYALGTVQIILGVIFCYLLGFSGRIRFESGVVFSYDPMIHSTNVSHTAKRGGALDSMANSGAFIAELFVSLISGPFFFIHGLYKLRQLSVYIKD